MTTRARSGLAVGVLGCGAALDVLAIPLDEVADPLAALARVRARILDGAAEPDIVTNDLRGQLLDVGLLHLELSRRVAAVVGLVSIRDVLTPCFG